MATRLKFIEYRQKMVMNWRCIASLAARAFRQKAAKQSVFCSMDSLTLQLHGFFPERMHLVKIRAIEKKETIKMNEFRILFHLQAIDWPTKDLMFGLATAEAISIQQIQLTISIAYQGSCHNLKNHFGNSRGMKLASMICQQASIMCFRLLANQSYTMSAIHKERLRSS